MRKVWNGSLIRIAIVLALFAAFALVESDRMVSAEVMTAKTWDGGGATNNWSDAANWSGDTMPVAGDDVTFDATSSKNVTIDMNINVGSIAIASNYTGTITQSNSAAIVVSGCAGRVCFVQSGGTFNGSSNTITLNSAGFGGFRMLGGTFNGGSGDINIPSGPQLGADFLLQGGTFKSTSGTLMIAGHPAFQNPGTVFLHNNGTVNLAAVQTQFFTADSTQPSITFNNLSINSVAGVNYDFGLRAIVEGALTLNEGTIGQGNNGTVIEARGAFSVSPNFDGGIGRVEFGPGGVPRTITLVAGLVYPSIRLNDPNVTVNTSGSGTLTMPHQLNIAQGTFNQGNVDMTINSLGVSGGPCLAMSGGTFNGSNKTISLISDGFGTVFMTGGAFNGGSGDITTSGDSFNTNHDIQVNGGVFKSTSGTLFVTRAFRFQNGGAFQNNGGTVVFNGVTTTTILTDDGAGHHPPPVFNNVTFNRDGGTTLLLLADGIVVNGTLSLADGIIDDAGGFRFIDARGNVNVASTFDGLTLRITLIFSGAACQTLTLNGPQNFPGAWQINKAGCGITANGNYGVGSVSVPSGSFVFGNNSHANLANGMTIDPNGRVAVSDNSMVNVMGPTTVSGDLEFPGDNGSVVAGGPVDISSNSGDVEITGDGNSVVLPLMVLEPGGEVTIEGSSNVVNAAAGAISGSIDITGEENTLRFDSLTINPDGNLTVDTSDRIILGGDVVNNGLVNLHGFGSECIPFVGSFVQLQSSVPGTRRNWSGNGVFRIVNANVSDMGGTATIRARNSLQGTNNGSNWIFDSLCQTNVLHAPFDFDGDSKSDVAMFRPGTQQWWLQRSTLGNLTSQFGLSTDKITPADFDGDGLTDLVVWRESDLNFYILESSTGTLRTENLGLAGDNPKIVADWDGDGKADPAVFRPSPLGSKFYYRGSRNNPNRNITNIPWGNGFDKPVRGDFDGDGKADAAIFRSDGTWWILYSSNATSLTQGWGAPVDKPVDGDFDGDGKSDIAVYKPDGSWWILQSSNGQARVQQFGLPADVLTPGDYDGDGKTDLAIFRPSNNQTWIFASSSATTTALTFGTTGDIPVASAFEP